MNPNSAKALAWAAALCILLALVMLSPTGAFALLVVAGITAAIPAAYATQRPRAISALLLAVSVALAAAFYPAFQRERQSFVRRAKERADQPPVTAPAKPAQQR